MMKRLMLAIWLCAGFAGLAAAEGTNLPVKIGAAEAEQHYDQLMTVTGTVAQVTLRPTIVFINLDHPYPDSPFAAIIHSKDTNQFTNLKLLRGRSVEITGKIQNYHDRAEIVVEKAAQILVPGGWPAATNSPAASVPPAAPAAQPAKGTNDLTNGVM